MSDTFYVTRREFDEFNKKVRYLYGRVAELSINHITTINGQAPDADGNILIATGSGTVTTGAINTLAFYTGNGSIVDDLAAITASRALISNSLGLPIASIVTDTELSYLSGATSSIQTQLGTKANTSLLSSYLTSATAASTYQPIGSYLTSITSSNVTTALGYTPYNGTTNPNSYISSSGVSSTYLPLAGGTLTGGLQQYSSTFNDDFERTTSAGSLGTSPTGHVWSVSGAGASAAQLVSGRFISTGNTYASISLATKPIRIGGQFSLTSTSGGFALISNLETSTLLDKMVHLQFTYTGGSLTWWDGVTQSQAFTSYSEGITFLSPLATDGTVYSIYMTIIGNSVYLELPDGTTRDYYDAHVSTLTGKRPIWQVSGTGARWESVLVNDNLSSSFSGTLTVQGGIQNTPIGNNGLSSVYAKKISIGYPTTLAPFEINNSIGGESAVISSGGNTILRIAALTSGYSPKIVLDQGAGANNPNIYSAGNSYDIRLSTAGSDKIIIPYTGNTRIITALETPTLIGGTGTTSSLTYKTTTGVGATGADHIFLVGNNGATEAMRIKNDGKVYLGSRTDTYFDGASNGQSLNVSQGITVGYLSSGAWINATTYLQSPALNGSSSANGSINIQGTTNATRTTSYVNLQPNGGYTNIGLTGSGITLGSYSAGNGAIWSSVLTPSSSNYAFLGDAGSSYFNAPSGGNIYFGVNNVQTWKINSSGHLLAMTDNTYDIGASGANRPRNIYVAGDINGINLKVGSSGQVTWNGGATLFSSGVGILAIQGTTSLFPAIKRNLTGIDFVLADNSAFTAIASSASSVSTTTTPSPASGMATFWFDGTNVQVTKNVGGTTTTQVIF